MGTHQFTLTGAAAGDFVYDRQNGSEHLRSHFRTVDALSSERLARLFEGEFEAAFDPGSGASFDAPVATAQIFLNDYMEVVLGIFDQPFGDWFEDQGPLWVNRFITAPLPFGTAALVPPSGYRDAVARRLSIGVSRAGCRLHGLGSQRAEL